MILKRFKSGSGITVIALVVTVIVLLIIAGITMNALLDDESAINSATDAKILSELSKVDEAIKLYKIREEGNDGRGNVDNNYLVQKGLLQKYTTEDTFRPIGVLKDFKTLDLKDKFGKGYKDLETNTSGYIGTVLDLKNVFAIDLVDGSIYYINNNKIWNLEEKTEIANNYGRVDANTDEWTFNTSTQTLTAYNWKSTLGEQRGDQAPGQVIIPNYYNGVRVKEIGNRIFANNTSLTSLKISEGLTTIGDYAFNGCTELNGDLIIPNSVITIGRYSFGLCKGFTGNLVIPNNVTTIDYRSFYGCSGFTGDLIIPNSVTTIGQSAFQQCSGFTGKLTISNRVTTIDYRTFYGCSGLQGSIIIPDSVTTIGEESFTSCSSLKGNLIIPDSVITIGQYAFKGCNSFDGILTLGENVETIGFEAFRGCDKLVGDLIIPDSVTSIGKNAFYQCKGFDGSLVIGQGVETIEDSAFYNCDKIKGPIIISNSVKSIGKNAFCNCYAATDVRIPISVETITEGAFIGLARESTIYLQNSSLESLISGKYTVANTTVVVDPSKFDYLND